MNRLLEDRPETVWALLVDATAVPGWLSEVGAPAVAAPGTPRWPAPGARLDYRIGRRRRSRVVTVQVMALDPGRRLTMSVSRPLLGSALIGRAVAGTVLMAIDLRSAPVCRTEIGIVSSRFRGRHLLPGRTRTVTHRAADRIVTRLVAQLRRRGPVMMSPDDGRVQPSSPLPRAPHR